MTADTAPSPAAGTRADRPARLARCLERARGGELGALDEVVRELTPLLWHVARAQGLEAGDAADVVQTTWLELLRRLHEIRSPQALTAWLISATRREAWHVNRRRRRLAEPDTELLDSVADPIADLSERVVDDEQHRVLWRQFQQLSQRCRELLRIVALVDRPDYAVVSEALSMPHGSIGPTRGRCLAKLRELLLADPVWSGR
ncbi:RNA polymerase sigma factor (sigma-70 family) [Allocatelliglobosispora scoriae]|uniref:RNA polymerase sigma factor (Sigma-70 family) n=1 Tax=Allocatelliglobosispora scoriae TaxID=643052 RepID=A0A841BZT9_9ACTN|nr:sigma-70 family RNA polymerase sigma factor [Allocatelliglobosispora scoriae]MBB5872619.1 RNA polymerase sigma factor (sigma-70 family) [Allocatelliglobosispora scoriae]